MSLEIAVYTGGITATNGYLCQTEAGRFAVDAPEGAAAWLDSRATHLDGLLLTHAHFDHVLDAGAIQQRFKCPVYAFARPFPDLTLESFLRAMDSSLSVPHYDVTHLIKDGDHLSIAGTAFTCLHIPGHSIDSLAFYDAESEVVFSGDTVMSYSVGRSDFPGGDHSLLIRGIQEKLMTLPDNIRVFPGHGAITTIGEERLNNAYLT